MEFSDDQMMKAIDNNQLVNDSYRKIKEACKALKEGTGCPDEDVDRFLSFLVGKWK